MADVEDEDALEPEGESEDKRVVHQLSAVPGCSRVSLNDLRFALLRRSNGNTNEVDMNDELKNQSLSRKRIQTYHPSNQVSNASVRVKVR